MNAISAFHQAFVGRSHFWHDVKVQLWATFVKDHPAHVRNHLIVLPKYHNIRKLMPK